MKKYVKPQTSAPIAERRRCKRPDCARLLNNGNMSGYCYCCIGRRSVILCQFNGCSRKVTKTLCREHALLIKKEQNAKNWISDWRTLEDEYGYVDWQIWRDRMSPRHSLKTAQRAWERVKALLRHYYVLEKQRFNRQVRFNLRRSLCTD